MELSELIGSAAVQEIEQAGAIRLHAVGDTGRPDVHNPNQEGVAEQMAADYSPNADADNPADSPQEQIEQRTIIAATQLAVNFARQRGVTFVAAYGNEHIDLGKPTTDANSPRRSVEANSVAIWEWTYST